MKKLLISISLLFMISSCNSLTEKPVSFQEVTNTNKNYPIFNSDGTPKLVADSGYRNVIENGVKKSVFKATSEPRQSFRKGFDSVAFVSPDASFIREAVRSDIYATPLLIIGVILLGLILPIWFITKKSYTNSKGEKKSKIVFSADHSGPDKFGILVQALVSITFFFFGMQGVQSKFFNISKNNTKQIPMESFRHYFIDKSGDTTNGHYFWDSIKNKNGMINLNTKK